MSIYKEFRVSKFKYLSFQLSKWKHSAIFGFELLIRRNSKGQDHAGISADITMFHYEFSVAITDCRHHSERN